ncbi:hypothetical protein B0T17DRAFT_15548 [Bombardia bombarda]|uniref:Secreted protein n=1 Tax=Bombardia bombarda TaxID=252184 RepID=A0AA40CER6_9PEZI|nr:hypothetical protein B0T17DRAFT_15548 [Bombardia bombarda]
MDHRMAVLCFELIALLGWSLASPFPCQSPLSLINPLPHRTVLFTYITKLSRLPAASRSGAATALVYTVPYRTEHALSARSAPQSISRHRLRVAESQNMGYQLANTLEHTCIIATQFALVTWPGTFTSRKTFS